MTNAKIIETTTTKGYKGLEVYFEKKPTADTLNTLKNGGFRWHSAKKCWYAYDNDKTRKTLEGATKGENVASQTTATAATETRQKMSLWERCSTANIIDRPKNMPNVEIAKEVRKHLKERFPEVKFSLRSNHHSIDLEILQSPYGRERIFKNRITGEPDRYGYYQDSEELEAVRKYFDTYLNSYNYDNSDPMTDYFDVGFYDRVYIASAYEQRTPTEEEAKDIADFQKEYAEEKARKEEEAKARLEKEQKESEERAKAEAQEFERKKKVQTAIHEHVKVVELADSETEVFTDMLSGIGKEHSLQEVQKDISEYEAPHETVIIKRKVFFSDKKLFEEFSTMFLWDWDFLKDSGGTGWNDCRIGEAPTEIERLTAEQRKTIDFYAVNCVGVYLDNELQFIVDSQGYSYARYVYLPTNTTTCGNGQEYVDKLWEESKAKTPFYIPKKLSEQYKEANIQEGEKFTAFLMDGMLCSSRRADGKLSSITPCAYAQYSDALKIIYMPTGKRNERYFYVHSNQEFVLYKGELPALPQNLLYTYVGGNMFRVNFSGEGAEDCFKQAIAHYEKMGYVPVINTVAR